MKNRTLYVAVVMFMDAAAGKPGVVVSKKEDGDYSCFVGYDKQKVTAKAIKVKAKWESSGRYGPYTVLVGPLTQLAKELAQFKLQPVRA